MRVTTQEITIEIGGARFSTLMNLPKTLSLAEAQEVLDEVRKCAERLAGNAAEDAQACQKLIESRKKARAEEAARHSRALNGDSRFL